MESTDAALYRALLIGGFIAAPITFVILLRIPAPYGRHARSGWGPTISSTVGWIVMESVAVVALPVFLFTHVERMTPMLWVLLALWEIHYLNRAFIYPLRSGSPGKTNPLLIVVMAMSFNLLNGYLNGHALATHTTQYTADLFTHPRFLAGLGLFLIGFITNLWADDVLLRLRRKFPGDYRIPQGGLYRYVSCPNYLGECLEWCGWALMVWNPAGLFFALWTAANLLPRARTHHAWYREKFPEYPRERRVVIPLIY